MSPRPRVAEANQYHVKLDYTGLLSIMEGFLTHTFNTNRFIIVLPFIKFTFCVVPVCREENGLLKTVVNGSGDSVTGTPMLWLAVSFPVSLPDI